EEKKEEQKPVEEKKEAPVKEKEKEKVAAAGTGTAEKKGVRGNRGAKNQDKEQKSETESK
ncbi:hypothetical protein SIL09_28525, partial [Bacillus cereus group sp. BfR-BA-01033]